MRCQYCHNPDTWEIGVGKQRTVESLLEEYEGVKEFMRGGGITCTGGEPMLQLDFLTELFEKAHEKGINTCLDTSGVVFTQDNKEKIHRLMKSTDLVMLDIKHIDDEKHKNLTSQSNKNILAFAKFLSDENIPVWIRHVVVPNVTDKEEYLKRLGKFIAHIKTLKALDVLPYHTMGKVKYEQLGMEYPLGDTPPLDTERAKWARDIIMRGLKEELTKQAK